MNSITRFITKHIEFSKQTVFRQWVLFGVTDSIHEVTIRKNKNWYNVKTKQTLCTTGWWVNGAVESSVQNP